MAERINAASVATELDVLDEEAKLVVGETVASIGFTNAAVKTLAPREWEELAAYLFALIAREPVKSSPAYQGHRIVLGALATELRGFAAAAGEPVGLQADLRGATSKEEERRIRERIADHDAYAHRYHDDVLTAHRMQQGPAEDHIPAEPEPTEEEPIDQAPAATPQEKTDDQSWLL